MNCHAGPNIGYWSQYWLLVILCLDQLLLVLIPKFSGMTLFAFIITSVKYHLKLLSTKFFAPYIVALR